MDYSPITLSPLKKALKDVTWSVPGSKSITNRALILAALRPGTTFLRNVLPSDDTFHMKNALTSLGISIIDIGPTDLKVVGGRHLLHQPEIDIFVGNSGTTVRFLCALAAFVPGNVKLFGDDRMAKRPIAYLQQAMLQMGIDVECPTGCPPVTIEGKGVWPGGKLHMAGDKSSQYFSALMLSGAFSEESDTEIQVDGDLVSLPYVRMTIKMVEDFGGIIKHDVSRNRFYIKKFELTPSNDNIFEYFVEPDASSASYPFSLAAATASSITVPGLTDKSIQGDFNYIRVLEMMGCIVEIKNDSTTVTGPPQLKEIEIDMYHISDTVMSLAAISPLCSGPVRIKNVANIRIKETDRLVATATELRRLGQDISHGDDWIEIRPGLPIKPACIECYDDHRIAMSFAILGKATKGITIKDPACSSKTYPNFWSDLETVCS